MADFQAEIKCIRFEERILMVVKIADTYQKVSS